MMFLTWWDITNNIYLHLFAILTFSSSFVLFMDIEQDRVTHKAECERLKAIIWEWKLDNYDNGMYDIKQTLDELSSKIDKYI